MWLRTRLNWLQNMFLPFSGFSSEKKSRDAVVSNSSNWLNWLQNTLLLFSGFPSERKAEMPLSQTAAKIKKKKKKGTNSESTNVPLKWFFSLLLCWKLFSYKAPINLPQCYQALLELMGLDSSSVKNYTWGSLSLKLSIVCQLFTTTMVLLSSHCLKWLTSPQSCRDSHCRELLKALLQPKQHLDGTTNFR